MVNGITHKLVAVTPDNPADEINPSDWNRAHDTTGLIKQTQVDFGDAGSNDEMLFTITDADVTTVSRVSAYLAYEQPDGKDFDEVEMDDITISCGNCTNGTFDMLVKSLTGSVYGKFKINYIVG